MRARFDGLHTTLGIAGVTIPEAQVQTVDDVPSDCPLAVFRDDVSHILASSDAVAASTASAHSLRVQ
jgi:hypothetical protein